MVGLWGKHGSTLADIERAIASLDPQLGELLVRYLEQADPDPGQRRARAAAMTSMTTRPTISVPSGARHARTRCRPRSATRGLAGKTRDRAKLARREAFAAAETSTFAPPRLRLGTLLIALYERGDEAGRAALLDVFARGTMKWGVWQAAKAIYKLAEERHDARDVRRARVSLRCDVGDAGTRRDRQRHARRTSAGARGATCGCSARPLPDVYPTFVVEVLRHYPSELQRAIAVVVAAHIWRHGTLSGVRGRRRSGCRRGIDMMTVRAFPDAWKLSPAPLLRLLDARRQRHRVCDFAIQSLRADHPLALRAVEPAWLARLGKRPVRGDPCVRRVAAQGQPGAAPDRSCARSGCTTS